MDRGRRSNQGAILLAWLLAATALFLVSACGSKGGAPVVSRDSQPTSTSVRSKYYRVRRGDTLYSIAWKTGVDFRELAKWNRIPSPYTIYPGQRLRLKPLPIKLATNKNSAPKTRNGKSQVAPKKSTPSQKTTRPASTPSISKKNAVIKTRASEKPAAARKLQWQWPTHGKVAQGFSKRDPTRKGLKIGGRLGQPIHAAEAGKIVYSGSGLIGYGKLIIIKHDKNYLSAYGHNRKILVTQGDEVSKGERIAEMGVTAGNQPVLHFEIRRDGKPVNPIALLPPRR